MAMAESGPENRRCHQASTGSWERSSHDLTPSACPCLVFLGFSKAWKDQQLVATASLANRYWRARTAAVCTRRQIPWSEAKPDGSANTGNPLATTALAVGVWACPNLDRGAVRTAPGGSLARGPTFWLSSSSSRSLPPDRNSASLVGFEWFISRMTGDLLGISSHILTKPNTTGYDILLYASRTLGSDERQPTKCCACDDPNRVPRWSMQFTIQSRNLQCIIQDQDTWLWNSPTVKGGYIVGGSSS
jgi:hypothetical protein